MISSLRYWWNCRSTCWWDKWSSWGGWFRCKRAQILLEIYRPRIERSGKYHPRVTREVTEMGALRITVDKDYWSTHEDFPIDQTGRYQHVPAPVHFSDEIAKQIYESNQVNSQKRRTH